MNRIYTGTKKRILIFLAAAALSLVLIVIGLRLFRDRRYSIISVLILILFCLPFYFAYEHRKGNIRRLVILSVMTAFAVLGRIIFAPVPGFKPTAAVVILTGIYMGPESGFLCGSLAAIISNMAFGQGPWTPFMMFAFGAGGLFAGLPGFRTLLKKRLPLALYGAVSGLCYSMIMDIWTVLSFDESWNLLRYGTALLASLPVTAEYAVSNVVFLMLMFRSFGERLERISKKHGIF